ncbi:MAG: ChbG/HpnK family deacetylase [Chloroflexi bacterium]|nr:ChbG/HpnK family deacetylase [Chloroflexota bacterium]
MNPILQQLGFAEDDRVVIIHADDFGMCHATIPAVAELFDAGLVSSAATMTPCSWFPAVAAYARANPAADIGVHTTLTCEWDVYRWGPISSRDRASGMIDEEGYFYRSTEAAQKYGDPVAVAAELNAQLDIALTAGIDVTHVDSHMGTVFSPQLTPAYLAVAARGRVPPMVPRMSEERMREEQIPEEMIAFALDAARRLEAQGIPLMDDILGMPLDQHENRIDVAKERLGGLKPGLSYFILHPAVDTPELRAIAPDWRARVADYQAFCSAELRAWVRENGLQVIGWRALRDAMRDEHRIARVNQESGEDIERLL